MSRDPSERIADVPEATERCQRYVAALERDADDRRRLAASHSASSSPSAVVFLPRGATPVLRVRLHADGSPDGVWTGAPARPPADTRSRRDPRIGPHGGPQYRLSLLTTRVMLGGMIRSFRDARTEQIWNERWVRSVDRRVQRAALRKLELLHAARDLVDLRAPPGNRLEALRGDRQGQHSIRVNDRWRICFEWSPGGSGARRVRRLPLRGTEQ